MKVNVLNTGDKIISYEVDEAGKLLEETKECIMCGKPAFFIARETKEFLCQKCQRNNEEARIKK